MPVWSTHANFAVPRPAGWSCIVVGLFTASTTCANAEKPQPFAPLSNTRTETDEMFQNAGEKGDLHPDPDDPTRPRANKQRGHGMYENDRPPIVGTVGRETSQVRLRVVHPIDEKTLRQHVHQFTQVGAQVFTDEWRGYDHIIRSHATVCHGQKEGREMMTAMESAKFTPTRWKACGLLPVISCVRFAVVTSDT